MADYRVGVEEDENMPSKHKVLDTNHQPHKNKQQEPEDRIATFSGNLLDKADAIIYAIVGISFLIGALFALGYSFWSFAANATAAIAGGQPTGLATAVIEFVSGLLARSHHYGGAGHRHPLSQVARNVVAPLSLHRHRFCYP